MTAEPGPDEPAHTTLLRASAGAGKTHALVEHYVHLVQHEGLSPANVVAITFTRKAAAELRRRIELRLAQGVCSDAQLLALAHAPIGNFHGLCLRWLDADGVLSEGGDVGDVLGEANEDEALFLQSVDHAWFSPGSALGEDVAYVAEACRIDDTFVRALWQALCRAREEGQPIDASLLGAAYAPAAVGARAQATLHALREALAAAQAAPGVLTTPAAKEATARLLAQAAPSAWQPGPDWRNNWQGILQHVKRTTQMGKVIDKEQLEAAKRSLVHSEAEQRCAHVQPRLARLLLAAWHTYVAQKARRQANDFSDLVAHVVARMQGSAALHARMRQQVGAVLVDEAQDVSGLQRELLHLLVGLRGPASNTHGRARWFVVGDAKQCIYNFRGADAAMFERLGADVDGCGGQQRALTQNFRSTPTMLSGINAMGLHLFGNGYVPLTARKQGHGQDEGLFACTASDTPKGDTLARTSVLAEARLAARLARRAIDAGRNPGDIAVLCRALSSHAAVMLRAFADEGVAMVAMGAGSLFAKSDVRQWLSWLSWLSEPREALGLAIGLRSPLIGVSDDAIMALFSPQARANDAIAALRTGDITPWLAALPAPLHADAQPSLALLAARVPQAINVLTQRGPASAHEALLHLFEAATHAWQVPHSVERLAGQHRLQTMAERDEARGESSARAWVLRHCRRMQQGEYEAEAAPLARAQRAVTLSSVHRAKGLEWDHVILPWLARAGAQSHTALQYDRQAGIVFAPRSYQAPVHGERFDQVQQRRKQAEQEEVRRLLYVAITRARTRVDLVLPEVPSSKTNNFYEHVMALAQAQPECIRPAPVPPAQLARSEQAPAAVLPLAVPPPRPIDRTRPTLAPITTNVTALLNATADVLHTEDAPGSPAEALHAARQKAARSAAGMAAHEALGRLLLRRTAGVPRAQDIAAHAQACLAKHGLAPGGAQHGRLQQALDHFCTSDIGRTLLSLPEGAIANELPFSASHIGLDGRTIVLEGKLDLLVQHGGLPWIVDFKYGHRPQNAADHIEQLRAYAWAVAQTFHFDAPIRCTLLYLLSRNEAYACDMQFSARQRDEVVTRLQQLVAPDGAEGSVL